MRKRKLWKIYDCLEKQEKAKFRSWLELELGGRQVKVLALLEGVEAYEKGLIPEGDKAEDEDSETTSPYFVERQLWAYIYPGEVFDYDQFRRLTEQLIRWLEEYLSIIAFRRDQNAKDLYLVKEVGRRDPHILFPTTYKKVRNRIERSPVRDATYYHMVYRLENEYQQYLVQHISPKKNRQPQRQQVFNQWWLLEKLEMAIEARSLMESKLLLKDPDELGDFFQIVISNLVKQNSHFRSSTTSLYIQLFYLLLDSNTKNIHRIISELKISKKSFSNDKLGNYFSYLFNRLVKSLNLNPDLSSYKMLYELYKLALNENLLFVNRRLSRQHYKNIVTTCIRIANLSEHHEREEYLYHAYSYLHNLKNYLNPEIQEDIYYFNLANYYLSIGEYDKVEASQKGRPFSDINYAIQGRLIALRARYEMNERKHLMSAINSFIVYLKNQPQGSITNLSALLSHLKFFRRLVRAQTKEDFQKLLKAISQIQHIYERNWLISKVNGALSKNHTLALRHE